MSVPSNAYCGVRDKGGQSYEKGCRHLRFLKEHGAKRKGKEPKRAKEAAPADRTALLAKLEERFILGEISEEAYMRLVEKYSEED